VAFSKRLSEEFVGDAANLGNNGIQNCEKCLTVSERAVREMRRITMNIRLLAVVSIAAVTFCGAVMVLRNAPLGGAKPMVEMTEAQSKTPLSFLYQDLQPVPGLKKAWSQHSVPDAGQPHDSVFWKAGTFLGLVGTAYAQSCDINTCEGNFVSIEEWPCTCGGTYSAANAGGGEGRGQQNDGSTGCSGCPVCPQTTC
jgi:hypothetical protein